VKRLMLFLLACLLLSGFLSTPVVQARARAVEMTAAFVAAATPAGNPEIKVWVNTHSGVYHCPGTRWYGKTKQGEYMKQKEAQQKGYRPAYGKVCE
jgi:hypothetical protein